MNPANLTPRKPRRIRMDQSLLLMFKLKRADCQAAGIEFPWQDLAALMYDVEQAAAIVENDMLMAEILSDAQAEAIRAEEGQHAQRLIELMSEEIQARRVFSAAEVFEVDEDFSPDERGELVCVPAWSGFHVTTRP